MNAKSYPRWTIRSGGISKAALLSALETAGVELNEAGRSLFAHGEFTTSKSVMTIEVVEASVTELGFSEGATMEEIARIADQFGLSPCPLETGPQLRLQMLDQMEGQIGQPATRHKAPPGSLTIVSRPISSDDEVPKGFYLRRIKGVPWLRGYRAGLDHIWSPDDHLLFATNPK